MLRGGGALIYIEGGKSNRSSVKAPDKPGGDVTDERKEAEEYFPLRVS